MTVSNFDLRLKKKNKNKSKKQQQQQQQNIYAVYFTNLGNFEISPGGYILVKKTLDAEVKSLYNLTIEAKDQGEPSRSNTVSNY